MKQGIGQYELYKLLKTIKFRRASGLLRITAPEGVFDVYLKRGLVIYIHTTAPEHSLPAFLLKAGLVEKEVLSTVISHARANHKSFDKAIEDLNILAQGMLGKIKASHQNTLLAFVLSLKALEIELKEKDLPQSMNNMEPLNVFPALCRAAAALSDIEYMRTILDSILIQGLQISTDSFDLLPMLKTFIGEHDVLYWIRQGELNKITPKTIEDPTAVRILFVLYLDDHLSGPQVDLPHEHDEILSSLKSQLSKMLRMNYYEILGVTIESPLSVVESKYNSLKRRFSSSRYESTSYQDKVEDLIRQIHELLDKARETLLDKTRRMDYNRLLKIDSPGLNTRLISMFNAQNSFMSGLRVLDGGSLRDAETFFKQAVEEFNDDPLYMTFLARVRLISCGRNDKKLEEISQTLKIAFSKNPEHPEILYTMAQLANKQGKPETAVSYIKRVLSLDPNHQNAKALLRVHTSQPEALSLKKGSKIPWSQIFDFIKGGGKK